MAANRFSSVREEMEKEISSRKEKQSSTTGNKKQSSTTQTLDSYMNQRAQSFHEQRKNGASTRDSDAYLKAAIKAGLISERAATDLRDRRY